jgi:hypothetical protein
MGNDISQKKTRRTLSVFCFAFVEKHSIKKTFPWLLYLSHHGNVISIHDKDHWRTLLLSLSPCSISILMGMLPWASLIRLCTILSDHWFLGERSCPWYPCQSELASTPPNIEVHPGLLRSNIVALVFNTRMSVLGWKKTDRNCILLLHKIWNTCYFRVGEKT